MLWHRVHHLPYDREMILGSSLGKVVVSFGRVTSNSMHMGVHMDLAAGWHGAVSVDDDSVPAPLRPLDADFDKESRCTLFRLQNLQRLREDLRLRLQFELTSTGHRYQFSVALHLGRPLIALAYGDRTSPEVAAATECFAPGVSAERKEAMEHTEDHSLSSLS